MNKDVCGFTCYWRIESFILRKSNPELMLTSPDFTADMFNSNWFLQVRQEKPHFIGVYLFKKCNPIESILNCSLSLLTNSGWILNSEYHDIKFTAGGTGCGPNYFLHWDNISNDEWTYLPNGCLTIGICMWNERVKTKSAQCLIVSRMTSGNMILKHLPVRKFKDLKQTHFLNFTTSSTFKNNEVTKVVRNVQTQTESISSCKEIEDLVKLFKEKDFSFVILKTKRKDFSVHKTVLCSKSPVFNAMFERNMKENKSNVVEIDDIDCDTLSLLMQYLYLDPLKDLKWSSAMKLYYAADKYQMEELKNTCLSFLKNEISIETVCDAFVLADLHQDRDLWQSALEFFRKNSRTIFKSLEWKDLLKNQTDIVSVILEKL